MINNVQPIEGGNGATFTESTRADEASGRARLLGLLASLFRDHPDTELLEHLRTNELQTVFSDLGVDLGEDFRQLSVEQLAEHLAAEFSELFLLPGFLISPHESVQVPGGKGLLRGPETTFVANYYATVGFSLDDSTPMEPDHFSIELEFLSHLAGLEADCSLQQDLQTLKDLQRYQKDFLQRHLGRWSTVFLDKVVEGTKEPFIGKLRFLPGIFWTRSRLDWQRSSFNLQEGNLAVSVNRDQLQKRLPRSLLQLLVVGFMVAYVPLVMACGWFGDGEDSGPEALSIGPDGTVLKATVETPASLTAEANRLLKFGLSGYAGAFRLFLKAAKQGFAPAQNNLANMYEQGLGVVPDTREAAHWYLVAARLGEAHAQHSIANYYLKGTGVEQDPVKGMQWMKCAARQRHKSAFVDLVMIYLNGGVIPADPIQAKAWSLVAVQLGVSIADDKMAVLNKRRTAPQLQQAQRQARSIQQHELSQNDLPPCPAAGQ